MNTIPLSLYKTGPWLYENIPSRILDISHKFLNKMNGNNFHYYDDHMCRDFIINHFPEHVIRAYDKLIPTAYKADLWRYSILYMYGGIYTDISMDAQSTIDFNKMDNCDMVLTIDCPTSGSGIQVALLASKPKLYFFKYLIDNLCNAILSGRCGKNSLDVTGPNAFKRLFCQFFNLFTIKLGEHYLCGIDDHTYNIDVQFAQNGAGSIVDIDNNLMFLFKHFDCYGLLYKDMSQHYFRLWPSIYKT